eukprot:15229678-Alexandrium_andersonii.AAC.1
MSASLVGSEMCIRDRPLEDAVTKNLVHSSGSAEDARAVSGLKHVPVPRVDALSGQAAGHLEAGGLRAVRLR